MSTKKAIFTVMLGNFAAAGVLFLINVFLARTVSLESFGRINLIFALIMLLYAVADFGICNTIVIIYNRFNKAIDAPTSRRIRRYYVAYLGICIVMGLIAGELFRAVYSLSITENITIFISFLCFLIYRHANSINQAIGNWRNYNFYNVLNNSIKILSLICALFIARKVVYGITDYNSLLMGLIFHAVLILTIAILFNPLRKGRVVLTGHDEKIEKNILKILVPIGIMNIFTVITMRSGTLIVEKVLGSEYLAIFSAANILAMVVPLITTSLMNVLIRDAAEKGSSYLPTILNMQQKYIKYLIVILVIGMLFSKQIIVIVFGNDFGEAAGIFAMLLIPYLGGVYYTPLESYFYGHDQKTIMVIRFYQMVTVVAGSILLAMPMKLYGIALSVTVSRIIGWVWITRKTKRILNDTSYA